MTKIRFMHMSALGALALALGLSALPAQAQNNDRGSRRGGGERAERAERQPNPARQGAWIREEARSGGGERRAVSARQAPEARPDRGERGRDWGAAARVRSENPAQAYERREARAETPVAAAAPPAGRAYGSDRNATYTAPRDRSYGANTRSRDWSPERQARDSSGQQQRPGSWTAPGNRNDGDRRADGGNRGGDGRSADWQRDRSDDARRADWQRDRRQDARRDERRDDARNYRNGYRDGYRADNRYDNRYGQNHRRWDNRRWRSDNRYDWYRYRASNRSLFSLGRYYAPYRGYSYSRLSIGFRLGSPFYSNRYWINDPWQYRLPAVYGPYRWVRYYDDALLVDIYSGEVVDVIHDFFW